MKRVSLMHSGGSGGAGWVNSLVKENEAERWGKMASSAPGPPPSLDDGFGTILQVFRMEKMRAFFYILNVNFCVVIVYFFIMHFFVFFA